MVAVREEMRNAGRRNFHSGASPEGPHPEIQPLDGPSLLARLPATIQEFAAAKLVDPTLAPTASGSASPDGSTDPLIVRRVIRENALKLENAQAVARFQEIQRAVQAAESAGDYATID